MKMAQYSASRLLAATALAVIAVGCAKRGEHAEWSPTMDNPPMREVKVGKPMFVEDMKDDDVVVAVNGVALTKKDLDVRLARYRWFQSRQRVGQQQKEAAYRSYGRGLVKRFITETAVAWEARKEKLLDDATVRKEVEKSVKMTLEQHKITAEDCDRLVPGGVRGIAASLETGLWTHTYYTNHVVVNPEINSSLVSNIMQQINLENSVIKASNAVARAKLEAARRRVVQGGEDFGKVADEVSEDSNLERDGTGYYGMFGEGTILDENVRKELFSLGTGDVSEIIEEDDGYAVYKVLEAVPAVFEGGTKTEDAKVDLARIFVNKTDLIIPAYKSDMVSGLREQDFSDKSIRAAAELVKKAVVVYPHGTNFWKSAIGQGKKKN